MIEDVKYFFGFLAIICTLFVFSLFVGGYIKKRFSTEKAARFISKYKGIKGNVIAALFGTVTPFCSCTSVPIFAGLIETNISFGVAISFLIASPAINLVALVLLVTLFGIKAAVFYFVVVFFVAVLGGYLMGRLPLRGMIQPTFISMAEKCSVGSFRDILIVSLKTFKYFFVVLILSAMLGVVVHNYVPEEFFMQLTGGNSILSVFGAVVLGSAVYADIIVLIPVGFASLAKGVNKGIVIAFLLSASGMSISQLILLTKIIKIKPIIYFVIFLISLYTFFGIIFYFL
jgi:uncharacterized protein